MSARLAQLAERESLIISRSWVRSLLKTGDGFVKNFKSFYEQCQRIWPDYMREFDPIRNYQPFHGQWQRYLNELSTIWLGVNKLLNPGIEPGTFRSSVERSPNWAVTRYTETFGNTVRRSWSLAGRSFDLRTSELWAQRASAAPLCSLETVRKTFAYQFLVN